MRREIDREETSRAPRGGEMRTHIYSSMRMRTHIHSSMRRRDQPRSMRRRDEDTYMAV
jgi:hypothetical protein